QAVQRSVREDLRSGRKPLDTLVLAAEPITDLDTTAAEELVDLDDWLASRGITLVFAELKGPVKDTLERYGLNDRFTDERFAPTVGAAVDAITGDLRHNIQDTPDV
ncbi:MAG: sodium-independent anion transporter, partial [Mycetocola sp.]